MGLPSYTKESFTRLFFLRNKSSNSAPICFYFLGVATAAGCQLVATCDLAVVSDNSKFAVPG